MNVTVKELLKLVNICQSYHKSKHVSFFMGHSVVQCTCALTRVLVTEMDAKYLLYICARQMISVFIVC